jgi:hypothetical protein
VHIHAYIVQRGFFCTRGVRLEQTACRFDTQIRINFQKRWDLLNAEPEFGVCQPDFLLDSEDERLKGATSHHHTMAGGLAEQMNNSSGG